MAASRVTTCRRGLALACVMAGALAVLGGCASPDRPRPTSAPPDGRPPAVLADAREFRVVPEESLLAVLVYRAGPLARVAHNHVIASRHLTGRVALARTLPASVIELHVPLALLTVDEEALRQEAGADFAAPVPESAREGTKKNMLSEALLDAMRFPQLSVRSTRIEPRPGGAFALLAASVRGETHTLAVPFRYELEGDELRAEGELELRHAELGLTPYSALLGAIQVQDEMTVRFRIVARTSARRAP